MSIIEVRDLVKTYRSAVRREGVWGSVRDLFYREYKTLTAVDHISFSVNKGELLGYIGPNGAGKSTSIKMLTGILAPTGGEMSVMGYHPFRDRKTYTKHIGVVFGQRTQLWWDIAVIESLKLLSRIYDVSPKDFKDRLEVLTNILDLKELLHTPVRKLSLGQRMRSDLAASLIHNPPVLFLDEPTVGLDAVGKDTIRTFLRAINRDFQTTILLTTHDLKEIEELCNRIMILDHGKIIFDGSLAAIKQIPGLARSMTVDFAGAAPLAELVGMFNGAVTFTQESERRLNAKFDASKVQTADLVKTVMSRFEVADLAVSEPSIDDVIMKIYREGYKQ